MDSNTSNTTVLVPVSVVPVLPRNGYFKNRTLISNFMPLMPDVLPPVPSSTNKSNNSSGKSNRRRQRNDGGGGGGGDDAVALVAQPGRPALVSSDQTSFFLTTHSRVLAQEIQIQQAFRYSLELPLSGDNSKKKKKKPDEVLQDQLSRILSLEKSRDKSTARFGSGHKVSATATSSSSYDCYLSILDPDLEPCVVSCRAVLEPCSLLIADSDWLRLQDNADDILCGCQTGHPHSNNSGSNTAVMPGFFGSRAGGAAASGGGPPALQRAVARWALLGRMRMADGSCDEAAARVIFGDRLKHFVNTNGNSSSNEYDDECLDMEQSDTDEDDDNDEEEEDDLGGDDDDDADDDPFAAAAAASSKSTTTTTKKQQQPKSKNASKETKRTARNLGHNVNWEMQYHFYVSSHKCPNSSCYIPHSVLVATVMDHVQRLKQRISDMNELHAIDPESQDEDEIADVARKLFSCQRVLLRAAKELDGLAAEVIRRRLIVGAEMLRFEHSARFKNEEASIRRMHALWGWYSAPVDGMQPTMIFAASNELKQDIRRVFAPFASSSSSASAAAAAAAAEEMKLYSEADVLDRTSDLWPVLSIMWKLPIDFIRAKAADDAVAAMTGDRFEIGRGALWITQEKLRESIYFTDAELIFQLLKQTRALGHSMTINEVSIFCGY